MGKIGQVLFRIIIIICLCFFLIADNIDYIGWKKVKFPSSTSVKTTIKIKKDWEFIERNNFIYLIDNNNIIAEQICEGYFLYIYKIDENSDVKFNNALNYDFKNESYYTFLSSSEDAYVYSFNDGIHELCYVEFAILFDSTHTPKKYSSAFIWYDDPNSDDLRLWTRSFSGGKDID